MTLLFFLSLGTFLISAFLFDKSADEMAYLAGSIALASFVVSLFVAPWQIQLLLLIFVFMATKRLTRPSERLVKSEAENTTQLTYRGVNYELTPDKADIPESDAEVAGKYRGQTWKSCPLEQTPVKQGYLELKYRGASVKTPPSIDSTEK